MNLPLFPLGVEDFIMTSCFPVVVGKSCLRLRKCFWHCLSRPIVGTLMMEGKYSLFYKYIYIVKNVLTTLRNFFILFTIIVLLIKEQNHILIFIENIAEYMILPELPQQIKEELLYLLQTASISRSVEGLGTI